MHAPEIDGTVFINDAPDGIELRAGDFTAAGSPRHTTTTCRLPFFEYCGDGHA